MTKFEGGNLHVNDLRQVAKALWVSSELAIMISAPPKTIEEAQKGVNDIMDGNAELLAKFLESKGVKIERGTVQ